MELLNLQCYAEVFKHWSVSVQLFCITRQCWMHCTWSNNRHLIHFVILALDLVQFFKAKPSPAIMVCTTWWMGERHALPPGLPPHCSWSALLCAAVLHSEHIKHKPALRQLCTCNYNRWRKHWSFVHCMRYIIYSTLNAIVMKWVLGRMLFVSH